MPKRRKFLSKIFGSKKRFLKKRLFKAVSIVEKYEVCFHGTFF